MGDFNDEPWDASVSATLGAIRPDLPDISESMYKPGSLYNLLPQNNKNVSGTLKFEGRWYLFDQFIVSGGLLLKTVSFKSVTTKSLILDHDFLFEPDEAYTGRKPFRTYNGYIYRGGYSDHLPIILNLAILK
jgi:hypothetical protein